MASSVGFVEREFFGNRISFTRTSGAAYLFRRLDAWVENPPYRVARDVDGMVQYFRRVSGDDDDRGTREMADSLLGGSEE